MQRLRAARYRPEMKMRSKVLGNTFWILSQSAFNKLSTLMLLPVLSRHLGAGEFGKLSFAVFYAALLSSIVEMGVTTVAIRRMRMDPGRAAEAHGASIAIGACLAALAIVSGAAGAFAMGLERDVAALALIASAGLAISFRDVTFRWFLEAPFRAGLSMRTPAILGMASESLGLVLVLLTVRLGGGAAEILAVYVLSNLPGFLALARLSVKEVRPSFASVKKGAPAMAREAAPVGASGLLNTLYLMAGSLILFGYSGPEEMGYYALAFRFTTSLRILPEALMHSAFPVISAAQAMAGAIFRRSALACALAGAALAAAVMPFSGVLSEILGGAGFAPAGRLIDVLMAASAFAFFNTVARQTMNAVFKEGAVLVVSALMAAASITLAFALTPSWGAYGACLSLAATEALGACANLFVLRRAGFLSPAGGEAVKGAVVSSLRAGQRERS